MRSWGGYAPYVSVAEKKAKAEKKIKQLRKKRPDIEPVILEGSALAKTWWGKSWNKNLERYADYSNRIGRGRSYVRHSAVIDLKITAGVVKALVLGSMAKPYEIVIRIAPIKKADWKAIKRQCQTSLQSMPDLLAGRFPKELGDIFLAQGKGLFPTPKEITFDCSCPDWASMCKHVAAALYGAGARLDQNPLLFFTLRQANIDELVAQVVKEQRGELLAKTGRKSPKVLDETDLSGLFGIDMEIQPDFSGKRQKSPNGKVEDKQVKSSASRGRTQPGIPKRLTATAQIEEIIHRNTTGTTVAMLEVATGFPRTKIYGITSRLRQLGKISSVAHGVYGKG